MTKVWTGSGWVGSGGAGGGAVDSVNGEVGVVVIDADDIDDTATTNKFATAAELTKLAGIEAGADVTDATNVAAAGAVMATTISASGMGYVNHGATAGTARPSGYAGVTWVGSVEPTNMSAGTDIWINTS